jgi:hypothetical protein
VVALGEQRGILSAICGCHHCVIISMLKIISPIRAPWVRIAIARRRTLDTFIVGIVPATPTRSSTLAMTAVFVLRGGRSDFAKRRGCSQHRGSARRRWHWREHITLLRGMTVRRLPDRLAIRVGAGIGHAHDVDRHHGLAKESSRNGVV